VSVAGDRRRSARAASRGREPARLSASHRPVPATSLRRQLRNLVMADLLQLARDGGLRERPVGVLAEAFLPLVASRSRAPASAPRNSAVTDAAATGSAAPGYRRRPRQSRKAPPRRRPRAHPAPPGRPVGYRRTASVGRPRPSRRGSAPAAERIEPSMSRPWPTRRGLSAGMDGGLALVLSR